MKLRIPDWKSAWFESHISERFFQEMSRVEKAYGPALGSSAQWMEQTMVDTGQLAHAMLRLEEEAPTERHIAPAADKALRLAALALHLATALGSLTEGEGAGGRFGVASRPLPTPAAPAQAASAQGERAAVGTAPEPDATEGPQERPTLWTRPPLHPGLRTGGARPSAQPAATARSAAAAAAEAMPADDPDAVADEAAPDPFDGPLLGGLMQVHGREPAAGAEVNDTIRSLAGRGLSRREIASITGQPREVVDAALSRS